MARSLNPLGVPDPRTMALRQHSMNVMGYFKTPEQQSAGYRSLVDSTGPQGGTKACAGDG